MERKADGETLPSLVTSAGKNMEFEPVEVNEELDTCNAGSNNLTLASSEGKGNLMDVDGCPDPESVVYDASVSSGLGSATIKGRMLDRVCQSDGHFKHQQRGEPDLTYEEKHDIAADLLTNKPFAFLTRFGKYLEQEDLVYFDTMKEDYMISYMVHDIQKQLDSKKNEVKVRNRRYEAMKELIAKGEYFSEEEMKYRDPLLYEQMIGQYMTDEEAQKLVDKSDLRFSTILLQHYDAIGNRMVCALQKEVEDGQMEESESDEDEEEDEMTNEDPETKISDAEKMMLRNDFMRTMQLRFLNGEDKEFDYSEVDTNVEYDSLDIREHDEEEKYFDDEEPETVDSLPSSTVSESGRKAGDEEEVEDYETYDVNAPQITCTEKLDKLEINSGPKSDQINSDRYL